MLINGDGGREYVEVDRLMFADNNNLWVDSSYELSWTVS